MEQVLIVHGGLNKFRAKAAAILVKKNHERFSKIIFSGGKTLGSEYPSEAEIMRKVFLQRISVISPDIQNTISTKILLESKSCDTEDNVKQISEIPDIDTDSRLVLLSSQSHLPRIRNIYSRHGFSNIDTTSAEELFWNTNMEKYQQYIKRYRFSGPVIQAAILEVPLYFLTQFDIGRRLIRSVTQKRIKSPSD